ncbi:hypothetical protein CDAR_308431 [Caerostris darwini]|uniref:Uncharacterized protein n=1 Tax=Caerostris darwini TaxID=1538125 RepID=A0AAV4TSF2_9ARAC|nr:hypothetical protein CDAR_308431 [Caerostris darwini]
MSKSSQPGRVSIIPFPSLCTSRYRLLQQQLFPKSHRNSLQEREHQFILLLDILFPTPEFKVTQEPTLSHASLSASPVRVDTQRWVSSTISEPLSNFRTPTAFN